MIYNEVDYQLKLIKMPFPSLGMDEEETSPYEYYSPKHSLFTSRRIIYCVS